jgi:hypothetical protein
MALKRTWQKGFADLLSIGVGITILGIVTAGSTAAMMYSRDILIRQEHYKSAAFHLRGMMEEITGRLQTNPGNWRDSPENFRAKFLRMEQLDSPFDMGGVEIVNVGMSQANIDSSMVPGSDPAVVNYYTVRLYAQWRERDLAGGQRTGNGQDRQIEFITSVIIPAKM